MATRIDRATAQRIIDTADIVEVVSDFVSLKRRGANYIGLCPFHSERTPSFSVSHAKGICKCFSCGKGGSAVGFIMEHEQMSYQEALRYLAKKYHIEIQEHELSEAEERAESERQVMLAANEFALKHFASNLKDTDDGRAIGMAYFRHRGVNDWAIERFRLGYSLERSDDLLRAALKEGYREEVLLATGLAARSDRGLYDRFRGRVMFPVFTLSGKVVAFGGRTLKADKNVAKYVNSPESVIYSKSNELYGLFQAKQAIVKADKCILVEGYLDVISMHQSGVENVVASSGTSLTQGQIRLIHRFTENVTVIYDSDAAGIKASLRGIDLLLAEGLSIKVLSLPDGDDPDSFAQSHSSTEVEEYLGSHEEDFIRFKTKILLADAGDDPVVRARVLTDILRSISVIPNEIRRGEYLKECALNFNADERVLARQIKLQRAKAAEERFNQQQRKEAAAKTEEAANPSSEAAPAKELIDIAAKAVSDTPQARHAAVLEPQERSLLRLVLKYGMLPLGADFGLQGDGSPLMVIDYVAEDLAADDLHFLNPVYDRTFQSALDLRHQLWNQEYTNASQEAQAQAHTDLDKGLREIADTAFDTAEITRRENQLRENIAQAQAIYLHDFATAFLERHLVSDPDDALRRTVTDLVVDRHHLSKIYSRNNVKVETEEDRLGDLVARALLQLKYDMARCLSADIRQQIMELQRQKDYPIDRIMELMRQQQRWQTFTSDLAQQIGERVYEPLR